MKITPIKKFKTKITTEGRICTACEVFKVWEDFKGHTRSKTGRSSKCRECYKLGRLSTGRKKELSSAKDRRKFLVKNEPLKAKSMTLRSSFMTRDREFWSDRSHVPTSKQIEDWLISQQPFVCFYSGESLSVKNLTVDHKVPLSRGGRSEFSNLCICSSSMNSAKGKMDYKEFIDLLKLIGKWEDSGKYILSRLKMGWRIS